MKRWQFCRRFIIPKDTKITGIMGAIKGEQQWARFMEKGIEMDFREIGMIHNVLNSTGILIIIKRSIIIIVIILIILIIIIKITIIKIIMVIIIIILIIIIIKIII